VESPFEDNVQYALENLTSGTVTSAVIGGTEVKIHLIRTWKSVSGHYCRRYEITITETGTDAVSGERTRCRETGGGWRIVNDD